MAMNKIVDSTYLCMASSFLGKGVDARVQFVCQPGTRMWPPTTRPKCTILMQASGKVNASG
jgi:hypothetical protein